MPWPGNVTLGHLTHYRDHGALATIHIPLTGLQNVKEAGTRGSQVKSDLRGGRRTFFKSPGQYVDP